MGLDMYLNKTKKADFKTYLKAQNAFYELDSRKEYDIPAAEIGAVVGEFKGFPVFKQGSEYYQYTSFSKEVAYWRKVNAVHQWFVDNVQGGEDDCGCYLVTKENLLELKEICKEIKADHRKAEDLLPTQGGFFFGSTSYDEWYFKAVADTLKMINKILRETKWSKEMIYYHASW